MNEIKRVSPAKINLFLEVINKRDDGYHNLSSLMSFCNFGDSLQVKKSKDFVFKIDGPFANDLNKADNIIIKAINEIEYLIKKKLNVEIRLTKNLPISSGMAGGSSNAATIIKCIDDLYKINITKEQLNRLLISLGSDVPFCFFGKTALVSGKGEKIEYTNFMPEYFVLLVNPRVNISTKTIFKKLKINIKKNNKSFKKKFDKKKIIDVLKNRKNDLEVPAAFQCKIILDILKILNENTKAIFSRMTGSGATCFGLYRNLEDLNKAYDILETEYGDFWIKRARIINEI